MALNFVNPEEISFEKKSVNKPRYTKYIKAIEPVIELIRTEIANSSKQIAVIDANMFKAEFGDSFKDNTVESAQWGFKYAFFIQGIVMNLKITIRVSSMYSATG